MEKDSTQSRPLGVFSDDHAAYLFTVEGQDEQAKLVLSISYDGYTFSAKEENIIIADRKGREIDVSKLRELRVARFDDEYVMTFTYLFNNHWYLYSATSHDLITWKKVGYYDKIHEIGAIVSHYHRNHQYVMYLGEQDIYLAITEKLDEWEIKEKIISQVNDFFGSAPVRVLAAIGLHHEIVLLYLVDRSTSSHSQFQLFSALMNKEEPQKIEHSFSDPIWDSNDEWKEKKVVPVGIIYFHGKLISYWFVEGIGIATIVHPMISRAMDAPQKKNVVHFLLKKAAQNPILKPIVTNFWESRWVFNPTAMYEKGKVHIVYRAIGDQDVSVMGYASSYDGIHIDERLSEPIYVPRKPFESSGKYFHGPPSAVFASGGGCSGGTEDPRICKIDDKYVMTYVAYNGWSEPRVALTSISVEDFHAHRFSKWEEPKLISRPGVVNKNACVFPEKINGKYVLFHRVFPNILVDYVDSLDEYDGQSRFLQDNFAISPRRNSWDSRKLGVGAPPIKTDAGWLLIYQAVGDHDAGRYKIGAMLLDLNDPTKVLHRSKTPILEPNEWYENEGFKAGVAYPCGAVIAHKKLMVYYGGADSVVCVAQAPIDEFIDHLTRHDEASIKPIAMM